MSDLWERQIEFNEDIVEIIGAMIDKIHILEFVIIILSVILFLMIIILAAINLKRWMNQ